ncbi:DUF1345 domain-containing protein [Roseomonas sp. KE2513]|uniref:DUF1345 domain-containing protein n=1 Tax=Roseomonas sp. KE2513 TaxID=2479202 RepID=UPI0018DF9DC3|nr:DUF1345 domain-containing protein [Roseomonas sp. KE2513]MBI0534869.1 DUF1345 domain-containing protein [Roseomonas sp. KE2513]
MLPARLQRRPILLSSLVLGLAAGLVAWLAGLRGTSSVLAFWNASALAYTVAISVALWDDEPEELAARAAALDQDQWGILLASVIAALAALGAVVADLATAKGTAQATGAALSAGGTVVVSWLFVQVLFAHHYAHVHWLGGQGLDFPGNDRPDFPEFLYFAMTVGMTAQVSDVTTRTATIRRAVLGHAALAFLFNAVILAAAVNLAAALLG